MVPASRLEAWSAQAARRARVHGSVVTYGSRRVTMVALGAPGDRPGMFWQVDGVVNPTVVVPAGAVVTVDFADADPGQSHGFEVTRAAPPYPGMAMMAGSRRRGRSSCRSPHPRAARGGAQRLAFERRGLAPTTTCARCPATPSRACGANSWSDEHSPRLRPSRGADAGVWDAGGQGGRSGG